MIKNITTTLLLLSINIFSFGQHLTQTGEVAPEHPRLVLMIILDNVTNQQLQLVRNRLSSDGFNRIMGMGTQVVDAYYDAGGNYTGKNLASLYTGAPAATHGIVGEQWIDNFSNRRMHAIYGDAYTMPSGKLDTAAVCGNSQLLCSTIGNEIRKMYNQKSKIFTVGLHPDNLMWCSGTRVSEPVICFNTKTGEMEPQNISNDSTLQWIRDFNSKRMQDIYLDKIWAPTHDILTYHASKYFPDAYKKAFYHSMRPTVSAGSDKYAHLAGSPYGNILVRDFATALMLMEDLGKDEIPDMLTLEFSTTPSVAPKQQPLDAESEDLLIQLDLSIASLLKVIDQNIGMHNTLVVVTAASGGHDLQSTTSEHWANMGVVSMRRASALLNLYLIALYGQAPYIRNYAPGAIYIDRKVAEESHVSFASLLTLSADFLAQVKGIERAIAGKDLEKINNEQPIVNMLRRNYHPKRSGDILIYLQPGWAEELDDGSQMQQIWAQEQVPLCFYGWRIPHKILYEPHPMTDVAPTLSTFIGVSKPNACSGTALPIVDK